LKNFIVGITGVGATTIVASFIRQFIKWESFADNQIERNLALRGILRAGIAAVVLGIIEIIIGLGYIAA